MDDKISDLSAGKRKDDKISDLSAGKRIGFARADHPVTSRNIMGEREGE